MTEAEAPQLYTIVRDLTSRMGIPMPKIYISPAAQPNAFATGRNPDHAAVAVTQGLLKIVDEDELRGVLAHEISHVANRDILHDVRRGCGRHGHHVHRPHGDVGRDLRGRRRWRS